MSYTKTTWRNNQAPAINADNLNHMEQGIESAHNQIDVNTSNIESLTTQVQNNATNIASEISARQTTDSSLQSQIDQLVAPTGEAPNPAEIENARIGDDGVTYDTLGNAIRTQFSNVKSDIMPLLKESLADVGLIFESATGYYDKNGQFYTYAGVTKATVNVTAGDLYFLTSKNYYNCARAIFFDSSDAFVSSVYTGGGTDVNIQTPVRVPNGATKLMIQQPYSSIPNPNPINLYAVDVASMIDNIKTTLNEIEEATTELKKENVSLSFESATGYYSKDGIFYTYSGVTTASVSVSEGEKYLLTSRSYYASAMACLMDENDAFQSAVWLSSDETAHADVEITIPSGIATLLIQRINNYSPTTLKKITGIQNKAVKSILDGKKVTLIGDSITEYNYRAKTNWAMYMKEWAGAEVQNLGASGTGFAKGTPYINKISSIQANPDIIGVALSFNDMSAGLPTGTSEDTGTASLAGYANDFFDALLSAFPTTPIICYCQSPWSGYHYGIQQSDDWISVLSDICGLKGIPFYDDMYKGSTLKPWIVATRSTYYTSDNDDIGNTGVVDDVHPNSEGHKVIARYLYPIFADNLVTIGLDYK